jgi:hypothetical protein
MSDQGSEFYCHRISRYFIKATNFVPYFSSEKDGVKRSDDFKLYYTDSDNISNIIVPIINSSLFYWFWRVMFDGYHCGKNNISAFPFNISKLGEIEIRELTSLNILLMEDFQLNSTLNQVRYRHTGLVEYDQFNVKKSKHILDKIDHVICNHLNFNAEEIDFIVNYEIKYRMGQEGLRDDE